MYILLQEIEENYECPVYAINHEYTDFGECYNLLIIEQGMFTNSTKDRLEQLEKRHSVLQDKLTKEKATNKLLLSKEDIQIYLLSALKKEPQLLVDSLVKKVILYNNKVEIYLKYSDRKRPDDKENHQAFIFFNIVKSYEINTCAFGSHPLHNSYYITIYA